MNTIILTLAITYFVILQFIYYLIIFHIIISWISLLGVMVKIKFVEDILYPIYKFVTKIIPTKIGPFDFTPIIVIFILLFLRGIFIILFPQISAQALSLL